jgi:hypothetical protein
VTVPVRAAPVLTATVKPTLALPDPDSGDTVIQPTLLLAVHGHPPGAAIVIVPAPPDAGKSLLLAVALRSQAAAFCWITARCPFMLTALSRAVPFGFAAAWNCTWPLPWPAVGARAVIHDASADAVHSHSGCVLTTTVPGAPLALIGESGPVNDTAHLGPEGPTNDSVDVEPHAEMRQTARMPPTVRQNTRKDPVNRTIGAGRIEQASRHQLGYGKIADDVENRIVVEATVCLEVRHVGTQDHTNRKVFSAKAFLRWFRRAGEAYC